MATYSIKDWNAEDRKYEYEDSNYGHQKGNILIPDAIGTYPVLVLFHGMGGSGEWQHNGITENLNNWISKFNFKPMVVVMLTLPGDSDGHYNSDSYYNYVRLSFGRLLNNIKKDTRFSSYIINDPKYSAVAGASMGGAAALFSGILYKDQYMHVGAFSPSQQLYYIDDDQSVRGWIRDPNQLIFNSSPEARQFMGYSTGELDYDNFRLYVTNYKEAFDHNKNNFQIFEDDSRGHNYTTFNRELFAFLYLLNFNMLPSKKVIDSAVIIG